jgi:NitT/TauT family transport system substrate-binding protein
VAEGLLNIEGFSDVQYVDVPLEFIHRSVGTDKIDISMGFVANHIVELDLETPVTLLAGVHAGCFELFGTKRVNAIRDLKGKTVAVPALGSGHHLFITSMAAYVGVDAKREINFVTHPVDESARLLTEEKVDALMGSPPFPRNCGKRRSAMSLSIVGSTAPGRSTSAASLRVTGSLSVAILSLRSAL